MHDFFSDFDDNFKPLKLWKHQEIAFNKTVESIENGSNPLLILPTGTGKTIVFSEVIKYFKNKNFNNLMMAHRDILIKQAVDKIYTQTKIRARVEKADRVCGPVIPSSGLVVVGSIDSIKNERLEKFKMKDFDLITIDEAHHATAKKYKKLLNHFSDSSVFGVTATPDGATGNMSKVFNTISYQYLLTDAIKDGILCPIKASRVKDFVIDLSSLRTVGGEFPVGSLDEVMTGYIEPIANAIKERVENLKTIIFMPSVKSSEMLSIALNNRGISSSVISGKTHKNEREMILQRFKIKDVTHLVNCDVLTEGFDDPGIECVCNLSPTEKRYKYAQRVGRGTRIYPGKDHLLIVEFCYNSTSNRLVDPYDLFAGSGYEKNVRDLAKAEEKNEIEDLLNNIEAANKRYYSFDRIQNNLIRKDKGFVFYDPFEIANLDHIDLTGELNIEWEGKILTGKITPRQLEVLSRFDIYNADKLSKAQASCLISILAKHGWRMSKVLSDAKNNAIKEAIKERR